MDVWTVKFVFDKDVIMKKQFTEDGDDCLNMDNLKDSIEKMLNLGLDSKKSYTICYEDPEDDMVRISDEQQLKIAKDEFKVHKMMRLFVKRSPDEQAPKPIGDEDEGLPPLKPNHARDAEYGQRAYHAQLAHYASLIHDGLRQTSQFK